MPFNFLKKSRHYNVTSKSLFVISVHHLLDTSTTVDCTLSSESTGQECLDNVCQRLSINQPEFFGLRYLVKGTKDELRWIDLERPLSRQLEKYAAGPKLYLRVMYYVMSGVTLLDDEVARYYYFLQLKSDVVEGKILCDAKQAILLALYSRQAEYDSYQKDKHTIDYLKTSLPFPKRLIEEGLQENLIEEVLQQNTGLHSLTQSAAEELYIAACQQLDGYGQEKFWAKDNAGNEVQLGITINGIAVCYSDNTKFYPWYEVQNVVNLKRTFNIEQSNNTVSFTFPDAETGRYFWKLCVLQHTFYMKYEKSQTQSCQPSLFQNIPEEINDSREDLLNDSQNFYPADSQIGGIQNPVVVANMLVASNQQHLQQSGQSWANISQDYVSSNAAHTTDQLDSRVQSSSCLDLSNNNFNQERDRLKALLPTYRPAPDYETAVQQKYRASSNEVHINSQNVRRKLPSAMLSEPNIFTGSQPDINHLVARNDTLLRQVAQHKYPDVTQTTCSVLQGHLGANLYSNIDLAQRLQMMRIKPPPPYPANRLSSTSTPDLAIASHRPLLGYRGAYVSGSSPDLVSTRTLLNTQCVHYPYLNAIGHSQPYLPHGTFENLNMIEEQPSLLLSLNHLPKKPNYEQQQSYRHQQFQDSSNILHKSAMNGSIEPIYENVPLPWHGIETSNEMRNRTSSIQSAPGGIHQEKQPGINDDSIQAPQISNSNAFNVSEIMHANIHTSTQAQPSNIPGHREESEHSSGKAVTPTSYQESWGSSTSSFLRSSHSTFSSNMNDSAASTSSNKEKRKKRWGILGRSKSPGDKQKSATLGREKSKNKNKLETSGDEANLRHRWSTGLPRLQPLSATFSKDKLCQILDSKLNDSQLFLEFERIPKRRENARYECALLGENKAKNSDPNFLPYDDNRVRITPTMDNRMGYVNASHITATVGNKQRFYIIAQTPHDKSTTNIFWQCIWEADVYLIIQLSEELNYIPKTTNKRLEFGQFQVYQEFSQTTDRCVTSKLRLYHIQSRRYRSVWHLNYSDWGEQNCPRDVGHFLDFLEELSSVRLASINEVPPGHNTNPPVLIHCREGGGRSGVALTADLLLYTIDHNQDLDIPRVIEQLRHQRDSIIPSLAQYKFIYALLITYLKRTRLI